MAKEKFERRKPPRHSLIHITVWSLNGDPVPQSIFSKIEADVETLISEERLLMQVVRL